jgi:hypothetical protein
VPRRRREVDRFALDGLIAARGGVLRASELDRCGVPRSTQTYRSRAGGPWTRLLPGILLLTGGKPDRGQWLRAALLYVGGGGMFTGQCALALYSVRCVGAAPALHLLVPHRRRRASHPGVVIERTTRLPMHRTIGALPVAPVPRAAIDAARRMREVSAVRALLAEVVQRGLCTVPQLASELRAAQRRGTALPRRVLKEVADGVRSVAEAELRELLLRPGVPVPVWNHDVFDANGAWLARPDAFWPAFGLVVEVDSMEWHLGPAEYRRTQARQRRMAAAGLTVLPVSPADLRERPDEVLASIRDAISAAAGRKIPSFTSRPAA